MDEPDVREEWRRGKLRGHIPPAEILLCAEWVERQDLGERSVGFSNKASANSLYRLKIVF